MVFKLYIQHVVLTGRAQNRFGAPFAGRKKTRKMLAASVCLIFAICLLGAQACPSEAANTSCVAKLGHAFCCSVLGLKYALVSEVIKEGAGSPTVHILANALHRPNRDIFELLGKYLREKGDREIVNTFDYLCE